MKSHSRSRIVTGLAAVAATTLTVASTIHPPVADADAPAVQRSSGPVYLSVQPTPMAGPVDLPPLLTDWIERIVVPPSLGAPVPAPEFLPVIAPTSIGTSIKGIYNAVEPWVQYGFDLAAYAVGWVPYVGWLAPQITIFYHFGERIARSITFNIADWLDGRVTFVQGLINVGVDTFNSFVQLGIDEWNFWLPPLPPLPPFPFSFDPPAEESAVEQLRTSVDALTIAASAADDIESQPNAIDEEPREQTLAAEPLNAGFEDDINATESTQETDHAESMVAGPAPAAGDDPDPTKGGSWAAPETKDFHEPEPKADERTPRDDEPEAEADGTKTDQSKDEQRAEG